MAWSELARCRGPGGASPFVWGHRARRIHHGFFVVGIVYAVVGDASPSVLLLFVVSVLLVVVVALLL